MTFGGNWYNSNTKLALQGTSAQGPFFLGPHIAAGRCIGSRSHSDHNLVPADVNPPPATLVIVTRNKYLGSERFPLKQRFR